MRPEHSTPHSRTLWCKYELDVSHSKTVRLKSRGEGDGPERERERERRKRQRGGRGKTREGERRRERDGEREREEERKRRGSRGQHLTHHLSQVLQFVEKFFTLIGLEVSHPLL
jgi:hypothetical protein